MKKLAIAWNVLLALIYIATVIGILSAPWTKFEIIVLTGLIQLYSAMLYNFSLLGKTAESNNHAAFARFRFLAAAHGRTGNEDGEFVDQENALANAIKSYETQILITRISHGIVSACALLKLVKAIL